MPFDMSFVVNDPVFAQSFTIVRSSGDFVAGIWSNVPVTIAAYGSIQPATNEELVYVAEADRVKGVNCIHTQALMYETHTVESPDPNAGISDIINWHNQQWKISYIYPWSDYGFTKALAVRMSGA
jgi:hypothetical protein